MLLDKKTLGGTLTAFIDFSIGDLNAMYIRRDSKIMHQIHLLYRYNLSTIKGEKMRRIKPCRQCYNL